MMEKAQVKHALCDARLRDELDRACAEFGGVRVARLQRPAVRSRSRAAWHRSPIGSRTSTRPPKTSRSSPSRPEPRERRKRRCTIIAIFWRSAIRTARACLQPRAGRTFLRKPAARLSRSGSAACCCFRSTPARRRCCSRRPGRWSCCSAIHERRVTTVFTAPIAYRAMAAAVDTYDIASLRTCVSAGETLPAAVWDEWRAKTGFKILDGIGSTEMLHIFIGSPAIGRARRLDRTRRAGLRRRDPRRRRATAFRTEPSAVWRSRARRAASISRTSVRRNYVQRGWNYPGDAYRRDEDGYFWYVARMDDMIVSAGYNISGPEVEQALIAHADVKEVAVVGKRDPKQGDAHREGIRRARRRLRRVRRKGGGAARVLQVADRARSRRRARSSSSPSFPARKPANSSAISYATRATIHAAPVIR